MAKTSPTPPSIREFGRFNGLGLWTLYTKEVRRFMRVAPQTILAPIVSNLLYMTVFVLAFAEQRGDGSPEFVAFLAPGLVMLGILNNASANSSSSIMTGKLMGAINDVLMPPLSYLELALGYIGGSVTRGLMVAFFTAMALSLFAPMTPKVIWPILYFSVSAAMMLGMIGILSGIWAEKFDQLAVVNQFIILPLSFLSGTFYHIDILPELFRNISLANPLFYLIDGFRYGFIGTADGDIMIGVIYTLLLNMVLFIICLRVLKSGWRLKA
jgi:ABC-2 type transport system permease protein